MDDLTGPQLLDIIMHMWLDNNIKCSPENREFIGMCLGLEEYMKAGHLRRNSKVCLDENFLTDAANEGYKMVVKPHVFFSNNNIRPFHGIVLVHKAAKTLYCTEESIEYLTNNCYKLNISLNEVAGGPDRTYILHPKS